MIRLYAYPFSTSQAAHAALRIGGIPFEIEWIDLLSGTRADGSRFVQVAPKGKVPAIGIGGDALITEIAPVLQYIADLNPRAGLIPPGALGRYRVQELIHYISTELHKQIFYPLLRTRQTADRIDPKAFSAFLLSLLPGQLDQVAHLLGSDRFLMGATITLPDLQMSVIGHWLRFLDYPLDRWPSLRGYFARLHADPTLSEVAMLERQIPNAFEAAMPGVI